MHRRTVHRGIAALALMTILSVAGARPAAAAHQGFLGQLAEAWSAATGDSSSFFDRLARWVDGGEAAKAPRATTAKLSWGIDPNGNSILLESTDPARPAPGHD